MGSSSSYHKHTDRSMIWKAARDTSNSPSRHNRLSFCMPVI